MFGKILMGFAGGLLLVVATPDTAQAQTERVSNKGFKFCNKTRHRLIQVAVAYNIRGKKRWASEGWWNVKRGRCTKTIKWNLSRKKYIYYFAKTPNRKATWTGKHTFCVKRKPFTLKGRHLRCNIPGLRPAKFRMLKVRRRKGIKLNLTR